MKRNPLDQYIREQAKARPRRSLRAIARDLGISAGYLSQLRKRKRTPSLLIALKIADYIGAPVESLTRRAA